MCLATYQIATCDVICQLANAAGMYRHCRITDDQSMLWLNTYIEWHMCVTCKISKDYQQLLTALRLVGTAHISAMRIDAQNGCNGAGILLCMECSPTLSPFLVPEISAVFTTEL